jgi:hypothetical protein
MSADFWMGFSAGLAFLVVVLAAFVALSKRMSAEARKATEATMALLADANTHRDDIRAQLVRIANELEQQGGRK